MPELSVRGMVGFRAARAVMGLPGTPYQIYDGPNPSNCAKTPMTQKTSRKWEDVSACHLLMKCHTRHYVEMRRGYGMVVTPNAVRLLVLGSHQPQAKGVHIVFEPKSMRVDCLLIFLIRTIRSSFCVPNSPWPMLTTSPRSPSSVYVSVPLDQSM